VNIFLDTEFNGFGGELLSIGLVADNNKFFYEYLEPKEEVCEWVAENVVPYLQYVGSENTTKDPVTFEEMQEKLELFLSLYKKVTIVADWPDDIKYFCELLITGPGTRISLPEIDFKLDLSLEAGLHSAIQHNALADAAANRHVYNHGG
jgi:hypothetical protein